MDNFPKRQPEYLSTPVNDNDDMCLLKSSIYFAFRLKESPLLKLNGHILLLYSKLTNLLDKMALV